MRFRTNNEFAYVTLCGSLPLVLSPLECHYHVSRTTVWEEEWKEIAAECGNTCVLSRNQKQKPRYYSP